MVSTKPVKREDRLSYQFVTASLAYFYIPEISVIEGSQRNSNTHASGSFIDRYSQKGRFGNDFELVIFRL
jgi:hypothetical protein